MFVTCTMPVAIDLLKSMLGGHSFGRPTCEPREQFQTFLIFGLWCEATTLASLMNNV